jgi:flagellar hook assembly protein FlgD
MKELNSYAFNGSGTDQFRIIFGDNSFVREQIKPETLTFGHGYPNPFREEVTIPFTLPDSESEYMVTVNVYDLTGNMVKQLTNHYYSPGYYTLNWNSLESSKTIRKGIYIIKMSVQSEKINTSLVRKVLKY